MRATLNDILLNMSDLCNGPLHPRALDGIKLFNRREFFEAHEALEDAWRTTDTPLRELYRGILQISVVYLHITRGNYAGALKVYHRSKKWLVDWPDTCRGIDVGELRRDLDTVIAKVRELGQNGQAQFDRSVLKAINYEPNS